MVLKKVAVIGYPVMHSLSPKLHGYWLEKYKDELKAKGIEGEYGMLEVKPEDLEKTLLGLKDNGYVGCNLTVPHKEAALEIVKDISSQAKIVGAVNTIHILENGLLFGNNTDVGGFLENIIGSISNNYKFDFSVGKAVVLGAGGAARAIIAGLATVVTVPEIIITNRTRERAEKIKSDLEKITIGGLSYGPSITVANWEDRNEILKDANLLVNTTVLGMTGQEELDINLDKLPTSALVTDIVYKPLETNLLKNARIRGNKVVDGLGMLLYQAQGGFELWFGMKPEVTEDLRKHMLS